jgi:hypothetical protein
MTNSSSRDVRRLATLLVLVAGLVASLGGAGAGVAGVAAAAPQLYLSPTGSDAGRCTQNAPCASFARAFALAPAGATVTVAAGDYTSCPPVKGSKSDFVTFVGAPGARVVCNLSFQGANHIELRGIGLYQLGTQASSYLRFRNLAVTCTDSAPYTLYPPGNLCDAHLSLNQSDHLEFTNVSIGPSYDSSACGGEQPTFASGLSQSTFKSVTFRDARWQGAPCGGPDGSGDQHSENFYLSGGASPVSNVTFDSCRFTNGPTSGKVVNGAADGTGPNSASLFLTGVFTGLIIRNCVFDGAGGQPAIDGANDASITNSLVQNNTWTHAVIFQYSSYPSLQFVNNLGSQQSCPVGPLLGSSGGSFSHNLWYFNNTGGSADRCGPTDLTANGEGIVGSIFTDFSAGDLHLKRGSPAVGRGDPKSFSARDRDGLVRPQGKLPDVGAFELPVKVKPKPKPKPRLKKPKPKPKRPGG